MIDVYLIGVFVTIIKMSHRANIQFDVGFFCFIGLVMTTVAAQASIDKALFWQQMEGDREYPREKISFSISITILKMPSTAFP